MAASSGTGSSVDPESVSVECDSDDIDSSDVEVRHFCASFTALEICPHVFDNLYAKLNIMLQII